MAPTVIGWDIGGAHVKASLVEHTDGAPALRDVAQWACPLWQGLAPLAQALDSAAQRWPSQTARAVHAVTMTGEMVDLFAHRQAGVLGIADALGAALAGPLWFYAGGPLAQRWCDRAALATRWAEVASANWHATAQWVAEALPADSPGGVLVDIGSTTTDLIAVGPGTVRAHGRSDAERLATGELVYHGVVRTPLCAIAPRIAVGGRLVNVMNEWFATSADVYRLTGELDPAHDLQPAADQGGKDLPATRQRLARMVGRDARDADDATWLALAQAWRAAQLAEIGGQLDRVLAAAALAPQAPLFAAGCGDVLVAALAAARGRRCVGVAALAGAALDAPLARRLQVAAPSAAVALLFAAAPPR